MSSLKELRKVLCIASLTGILNVLFDLLSFGLGFWITMIGGFVIALQICRVQAIEKFTVNLQNIALTLVCCVWSAICTGVLYMILCELPGLLVGLRTCTYVLKDIMISVLIATNSGALLVFITVGLKGR